VKKNKKKNNASFAKLPVVAWKIMGFLGGKATLFGHYLSEYTFEI
jgi:hypothetical protein